MDEYNRIIKVTLSVCFGIALIVYGIGSYLPDSFLWGVNHLAFLRVDMRLLLMAIVLVLGLPFVSERYLNILKIFRGFKRPQKFVFFLVLLVIGATTTAVCYYFRIMTDMYGDARTIIDYLTSNKLTLIDVFRPDQAEPLTGLINQNVAALLQTDIRHAYQLVSSLCGGLFVVAIIAFIRKLNGSMLWKNLFVITFITAGANQLYFGYVEDYTLIYLCALIFCMASWMFFEGEKTLWVMSTAFIVGSRLHVEMILFLPALIYAVIYSNRIRYQHLLKWLEPQRIIFTVATSLIFAVLAYFFYFKAYRYIVADQEEIVRKIFLPIVNYPPPSHHYTLLTLNHASDFIQVILLTVSPASLMIYVTNLVSVRRIEWREPRVLFFGLAALYFLIFNFTVNMILSMPRDWDLLSIAAIPIMFFALALYRKSFEQLLQPKLQKMAVGFGFALGIFSCAFFAINSNADSASQRLEGVGKWIFKSYYFNASYVLNISAKMAPTLDKQIERRVETIQYLLPYASASDQQIGFLYHKLGTAYFEDRQFDRAAENFSKSLERDSANASAVKMLGVIALQTWRFDEGFNIISYYNQNINRDVVRDQRGVDLANYCGQLKSLIAQHADSSTIQRMLNEIYLITSMPAK